VFGLGHHLSKHITARHARNLGGHGFSGPLATPVATQWRSQPEILGDQNDCKRATAFRLEHRFSKHKMTGYAKNLGDHGPPELTRQMSTNPEAHPVIQRRNTTRQKGTVRFQTLIE